MELDNFHGRHCLPTCTSREELTKSPKGMRDILALKLPRYLVQSKFTIFSIKIKGIDYSTEFTSSV